MIPTAWWCRNSYLMFLSNPSPIRVRSLGMLVTNWLTHWLTDSCLVNLIDLTLACEDNYSKLVEVVTVAADVDDEDRVGNSFLQIWKLRFGNKANFCSDFQHKVWSGAWGWISGEILKHKFGQHYAADVWFRLRSWILVKIMKLGLVKILSLSLFEMLMYGSDLKVNV